MTDSQIPTNEIKCPLCGGTRFDPHLRYLTGHYPVKYCGKGFFSYNHGLFVKARACMDCGHVDVYVDADKLARLVADDDAKARRKHPTQPPPRADEKA
jgi:ribosomal protein S27E